MTPELAEYLETIRRDAKLEQFEESAVISELEAHIEDAVEGFVEAGYTREEAVQTCIKNMGGGKMISRLIYEAHSQGSWRQALLASAPHMVFGLLFALNWWQHPGWLTMVLLITLAFTAYGWIHGRPNWIFSWLGISLLPVLACGVALLYLPKIWSLAALLVYFPLAAWWLFRIVVETTKRDWIFASMALVPLPIIGGWFMAIVPDLSLSEATLERVSIYAPWIGLSFFTLALTIAVIIRLRQRSLRITMMVISGVATLSLVSYYCIGRMTITTFFGLMLVMWGIFLVPPVAERLVRKGNASLWRIISEPPVTEERPVKK